MSGVESQSSVPGLTGIRSFHISTAFLLSSCSLPCKLTSLKQKIVFPKVFELDQFTSSVNIHMCASRPILHFKGEKLHWHWCMVDAHGKDGSSCVPTQSLKAGMSWAAEEARRAGSWVTASLPCGLSSWVGRGKFLLSVFKAPNLWYGFRLQLNWSNQNQCSTPLPLSILFCCFFVMVQLQGELVHLAYPRKTYLFF